MMRTRILCVLGAVMTLAAAAAQAIPITYVATLENGVWAPGTIADTNTAANPVGAQYYRFFANAGSPMAVTVEGDRLEQAYDMAFWLFSGEFTDTNAFGGSFDGGDAGFIAFGDDEIPDPGPFGDPFVSFFAPVTGFYTVAVTNFFSGPSGDGFFDFRIQANNIVNVPEPSSLALFGVALVGLGIVARRRRHLVR